MTADIELLPSSVAAFTEALKGERGSLDAWLEVNDEREVAAHVEAYTRANVAHATAAQAAEIEALRVRADAMAGEAIKHEARAERMAEALRFYADTNNWVGRFVTDPTTPAEEDGGDNARESLRDHDQETGNG